ncbi:MAG: transcriptional coactivator p15/PC4 family protein [Candidatus Eiseniibacteriota bacterium]
MEQVITKVRKNASTEVWVVLSDFTGALRLNLREYFRAEDGVFRPTRKGVGIDLTEITGLLDGLNKLAEASQPGTVAVVARRTGAEILAGVREYQGHTYGEIRQFVGDAKSGWKPTGKGVTFKAGLVPTLMEAVEKAEALISDQHNRRHPNPS